ncbi:aminotransferase class I/II-fold pyridoxal phosphate-dependent enzyme [uncultured Clostridium sp.]|uniref:aminotransferase class I/II-fold pyridoxal phosphate-dependent enzyme n=1 Tax=uncultured Clostridium sp. TaxID=59620 RepID=UPI0025EBE916|nr:aminotransferase class I/II-fold pyridoxal phosphate-dependent enzyme [uncultured Clostridium sp.]
MIKKKIFLSSPHMGGEEQRFIREAFDTNWIAPLGKNVDEFENAISKYLNIKRAVATVSGTSAIHMALKCAGVNKGDIVFCSALTFSASCNPIIYEGAIPVFIDSEENSWNMSPKALEKAFNIYRFNGKLPKAVIVVDLYGESADFDSIKELCREYNVTIIEDSAEALGSKYKDKYCGSLGEYGVFSFNGNKIITTSGGGAIVSNNEEKMDKTKFWITQSREKKRYYEHRELGYNYRMSNIVAGIGRGQLKVLDSRIEKKRWIYNYYKEALKDIKDVEMKPDSCYGKSNQWLSCILINKNSKVKPLDLILNLERECIEGRHIWKPMNMQPYYKKYDFISTNKGISVAEDIFSRGVCLPSDTKNTEEDMERIVKVIKRTF